MQSRFDGLRRIVLDDQRPGRVYFTSESAPSDDVTVSSTIKEIGGIQRVGLQVAASVLGCRLVTMWPDHRGPVLTPEGVDLSTIRFIDFPRGSSKKRESVTLKVNVKYRTRIAHT